MEFIKEFIQDMSNPLSFVLNYVTKNNEYRCEIRRIDNERAKVEIYYKYHTDRLIYAFELISFQLANERLLIEYSFEKSERIRSQTDRIISIVEDINENKIPNSIDENHRKELFGFANNLIFSLDSFNKLQEGDNKNIAISLSNIKTLGGGDILQLN